MNLLDALNDKQREAAETIYGPVLILAGAGSGKTRTVIYRIAHILTTTDTPAYRILALTFTNKAAGEMRERINTFGLRNVQDMWIGTFHSIFARILRIGAEAIGFTHNFTIYDDTDSKNLLAKCIEELNFNNKVLTPSMAREVISRAKNSAVMPQDFSAQFADIFRYEQIGAIYALYQQKLKENNAMDFDDLLLNTLKLFKENDDILAYYQDRFVHILVDEYQDTNALQYEILSMIAKKHGNICVCGDDDQSIYGWRGADIRNILEFESDFPNAKVVRLEQNYRSTAISSTPRTRSFQIMKTARAKHCGRIRATEIKYASSVRRAISTRRSGSPMKLNS
jgi:DNA helicase-2/ATP-dependent DNA helicase PcrA